jgi:Spy/CpxP family protein refolding chaperone
MKKVVLVVTAGLAIVAGAAVVDAQRSREDRGAFAGDQVRIGPGYARRAMFGLMPRQGGGRGPGGGVQGPGRGGRGGPGGFGGPMLAALDLTEEQRTKIQEIHRSSRESVGPIAEQMGTAQRALHLATFAETRDDGEIAKLTSTIANLEKQLLDQRVKTDLAIAAVLTAEQREKVRAGRGTPGGSH